MKLYTYVYTVGGEDEYLIAKDDQIAPEAGPHEERFVEELTEETFMNAFRNATLQGAIYLFMTTWDLQGLPSGERLERIPVRYAEVHRGMVHARSAEHAQ